MHRSTRILRAALVSMVAGAVLSACAVSSTSQSEAAGSVVSTTAAANAPHPLTTVPGVRVGVHVTGGTAAVLTAVPPTSPAPPLPTLAKARVTGTVLPAKRGPAPVRVTSVDGCNRAYGTASQCIPLLAPGGAAVTCAYLQARGLFAKPLIVVTDPLGLLKKPGTKRGTTSDGKYTTIAGCTD